MQSGGSCAHHMSAATSCVSSPRFLPQCRCLHPSPPTLRLVHLSCDVLADENESMYYSGEAVGLGGSGAGEITKEKGRRTRHKVGCGARAQALAGMNDHERGGRGTGRRARVQAPALRREPRRREASEVACTGNIQREEEDRHRAHLVALIFTRGQSFESAFDP